ncbi:hypothetical protein HYDPIDRAFT_168195 [Hydnomerulius pinastri MD-312]|uniref:Uncharacterized protein n=1 Tax=Hydnomerulius pinastri MD-312 TaxID=994086 RepID=A0A0C9WES0_9AGAM|nr:hypothetical protein HYDPIDRAFT_168195 [Hydnomerulius pinastri MD-312]
MSISPSEFCQSGLTMTMSMPAHPTTVEKLAPTYESSPQREKCGAGSAEEQGLEAKKKRGRAEDDDAEGALVPPKRMRCSQSGKEIETNTVQQILSQVVREILDLKAQLGQFLTDTVAQLEVLGQKQERADRCRICCPRQLGCGEAYDLAIDLDPMEGSQLPLF